MKPGVLVLLLGLGILSATREPGAAPERSPHLLAASASPSGGVIQPVAAGVDDHPADGTSSNVNGVLEPGETVQISPFWKNTLGSGQAFTGSASNLSGPPGPSYSFPDAFADYGTVASGATADCATATGDCYLLSVQGARPVPHWDVAFTETLSILGISTTWTIHVGESFTDVPTTHPFYAYIEQLFHLQITGGCGAGLYCPGSAVTRQQMAAFLLKAEHGSNYVPPGCAGVFGDVPCPSQFADWIEQLYNEGITGGCQASPLLYCPGNPVTRAQMAAFLLKTEHGPAYVPPACQGIFADVPCPSQFADWIEQLFNEGITGGCGGNNYCPNAPVTRGQMAVFLLRTFAPLTPPVPTPTAPPVTATSTPTLTPTVPSPTPTLTGSMPPTHTNTPTPTATPSVTLAPSVTPTLTGSATQTATFTRTNTNTPTFTRTPTGSPTPTATPTGHLVFVGSGGNNFVDSVSGTSITTITAGETVTWVWQAGLHSTTSGSCTPTCIADGNWNSGQHSPPFTFMHTFSTANPSGYNYFCSVHGAMMQGIVFVNSAPGAAPRP
jgi:plastocyanin